MPKTREQKELFVKELTEELKSAKGTVFATYEGLTVFELEDLRAKLREQGVRMIMAKKTLLQKAVEAAGLSMDDSVREFNGAVTVVLGHEDEVSPAKIMHEFAKDHEQVSFFGGFLEGSFIPVDRVEALAKLPSRVELLAKVVGSLNAPMSGLVNVLNGNTRSLVYALKAIQEKKSNA